MLTGTYTSENGQAVNVTLADITRCGYNNDGIVNDMSTCDAFTLDESQISNNVNLQLSPGTRYNLNFEDSISQTNSVRVNFVLNYN